jgi:predicted CXXCH cytochrome family protein
LLAISCSNESLKRVYYTFFDSTETNVAQVKEKDSTKQNTAKNEPVRTAPHIELKQHPPYADRSCELCHSSKGSVSLQAAIPDLCYGCHDDFSAKYPILHGPTSLGACNVCHDPHESQMEKLLTRKGQELCTYCHDQKDFEKTELHKDIGDQNCQECHNPHGGIDRTFMK